MPASKDESPGKNKDCIEVSLDSDLPLRLKRRASRAAVVDSRTPPRNTRRGGPSTNTEKSRSEKQPSHSPPLSFKQLVDSKARTKQVVSHGTTDVSTLFM